jgi:hypothetical protein
MGFLLVGMRGPVFSAESIHAERREIPGAIPFLDETCDDKARHGRQGHAEMPVAEGVNETRMTSAGLDDRQGIPQREAEAQPLRRRRAKIGKQLAHAAAEKRHTTRIQWPLRPPSSTVPATRNRPAIGVM